MVVFNHKRVIIDSIKLCTLTVATDCSEDLLIHFKAQPKFRPAEAGLHYVEKEYHSKGLTGTKKQISDHYLGKKVKSAPPD